MSDKDETIELAEAFMVLGVPKNTIEVEINATIWQDGRTMKVSRTMEIDEIRKAFQEAEECYIPSDTVFTLTDLGRETLEKLKAEYRNFEEEE